MKRAVESQVYEKSPVGIAIITEDHKIAYANESFCMLLGWTEHELQKMDFKDVMMDKCAKEQEHQFSLIKSGQKTDYWTESKFFTKQERVFWARVNVEAVYEDSFEYAIVFVQKLPEPEGGYLVYDKKQNFTDYVKKYWTKAVGIGAFIVLIYELFEVYKYFFG